MINLLGFLIKIDHKMSAVYSNNDPKNGIKQCPICLNDGPKWTFHGDQKHIIACLDCIKKLDRRNPICPQCREALDPSTYLSWKERNIELIESAKTSFITSIFATTLIISFLAAAIFSEFDLKKVLGSMIFIYAIAIVGLIAYIRKKLEEENI